MHDDYLYPGTSVLRNNLGTKDADQLEYAEIKFVTQRILAGVPDGKFDLNHLQSIHKHLFQDVYEWAGEIRTVEISKGGNQFMFLKFLQSGMADVHARLVKARYLHSLGASEFARRAGEIMGDVNYAHPFREGNGRTQLQYLKKLAEQAGHSLDLSKLGPEQWINASKEAHFARYDAMAQAIRGCIIEREKKVERGESRGR